jgi:hypothetical protein
MYTSPNQFKLANSAIITDKADLGWVGTTLPIINQLLLKVLTIERRSKELENLTSHFILMYTPLSIIQIIWTMK